MTIEFSCSHCNKVLKTSDDKAGRKAKCPQCGEPVTVPMPDAPADDDGFDEFDAPVPEANSFLAEQTVREEDSFLSGGQQVCPMCGESVPAGAVKCDYCGETLQATGRTELKEWQPRKIEMGAVLSRAWEVFTSNLGRVIGLHVMAYLLSVVAAVAVMFLFFIVAVAVAAVLRQANPGILIALLIVGYFVVILFNSLFQLYFMLGVLSYILKLVRGEEPSFNELFSGWPYLGRMLLCSIVFFIMYALGLVCLIIPGIIIGLMFGPYPYMLIDRNLPGIEALTESRHITKGNLGVLFLISLVLGGLMMVPYLSLVFGSVIMDQGAGPPIWLPVLMMFFMAFIYLALIPFTVLVGATSYAEMTNQ